MDCSKSVRKYPFLDLGLVNEPYAARLRDVCSHVIAGGRYVGGREVEEFECELAAFCGCRYAVGTANGLDALRLILLSYIALGVMSPGDEVIVPANTYIATFLAVTHAGLVPVPVESDMMSYNIDVNAIADAVTPRTRAIMPVHLYGRPCEMEVIREIATPRSAFLPTSARGPNGCPTTTSTSPPTTCSTGAIPSSACTARIPPPTS